RSMAVIKSWVFALALGGVFLAYALWNVLVVSLASGEGTIWDVLMEVVLWSLAALLVLTLARFLALCVQLGDLLAAILRVPMVGACERWPDEIRRLFGGYLYAMEQLRESHVAVLKWLLPAQDRELLAGYLDRDFPAPAACFHALANEYLTQLAPTWPKKSVKE